MIIAGIGSRETPKLILDQMLEIGKLVALKGGWVRSGHASGADLAFEMGAKEHTIVYLPWRSFGGRLYTSNIVVWDELDEVIKERAIEAVRKYHPAPERLKPGAWKLMGRNYLQVFGSKKQLKPVDAIICWTPGGKGSGGTGQAIRIAKAHNIPVIDLGRSKKSGTQYQTLLI